MPGSSDQFGSSPQAGSTVQTAATRLSRFAPFLLIAIALLAAVLRFADLEQRPAGLFRDEAEKGFNAWALAHTGTVLDLTANPAQPLAAHPWPWMMTVMGNRTSSIYQYASSPFMIGASQPSVARTRAAAALCGSLTVLLLGIVIMRAWGAALGLAAALWLALCPWHLVFSRWALEGIFVPFWMALALGGLLGVERARRWGWPLVGLALGLLFYSYTGAQPFVAAWALCILVIYRKRLMPVRWPLVLAGVLFLIPVVPTLVVTLAPGGTQRLSRVALWSDPTLGPGGIAAHFIVNWLRHFSPVFLFWSGDAQPRHAIPGMGQLLIIDALLLPLGAIWMLRGRAPLTWALLTAFMCGPIPAALTREGLPHALRSIAMLLPAVIFSAAGLVWLMWIVASRNPRGRLFAGLIFGAALILAASAYVRYMHLCSSPLVQVAFEKGERESWESIQRNLQSGEHVYIDGYIPYAAYYQYFFFPSAPREIVRRERESPGRIFVYFDPQKTSYESMLARMAPRDWIMTRRRPDSVQKPDGSMLLTPEEAARVGEGWVEVEQK